MYQRAIPDVMMIYSDGLFACAGTFFRWTLGLAAGGSQSWSVCGEGRNTQRSTVRVARGSLEHDGAGRVYRVERTRFGKLGCAT